MYTLNVHIFLSNASFSGSVFADGAHFKGVEFRGGAIFNISKFEGYADFEGVDFNGESKFESAYFEGMTSFESAVFSGPSNFGRVTMAGDVTFDTAVFLDSAKFMSAKVIGYSKFVGTRFRRDAVFRDAQFEKPTSFRDAAFDNSWPVLTGAILHPRSEFSTQENVAAADEIAPEPRKLKRGKRETRAWPEVPDEQTALRAARDSAAIIRHTIAQQGVPENEHFFFRKEMGFRARIGGWWARLPYRLFRLVSDFGNSICRPAAGLLLTFAVFWPIIGSFLKWNGMNGVKAIWTGSGISFANTFPLFGFGRTMHPEFFKEAPAWMDLIAGAQTVLGFVFLFFLGLGLRTRFRLR